MSALSRQSDVSVEDLIGAVTVDRGIEIPVEYGRLYARRQREGSDRQGAFYATMVNHHGAFCWSQGLRGGQLWSFAERAAENGRSIALISVPEDWPNSGTAYPGRER